MSDPSFGTEASMRLQTRDRDVSTVSLKFYVYIKYMSGKMIEQKERKGEALTGLQTEKSQEKSKRKRKK